MTKNESAEEDVDLEDLPQVEEGAEDKTDWKAIAQKNHGIAQRYKTKLDKQGKVEKPVTDAGENKGKDNSGKEAGGLDKLDRAVLRVEKITDSKEVELVQTYMKETGRDVEGVLASKFFQAELKEMRDLAATEEATPSGSKRSGVQTRDTVEYWIAAGKLPPPEQAELRRKVVNAKIAKEKSGSMFSTNPIQ